MPRTLEVNLTSKSSQAEREVIGKMTGGEIIDKAEELEAKEKDEDVDIAPEYCCAIMCLS